MPLSWLLGGAAVATLLASGVSYYEGAHITANKYELEIATMKLSAADDAQKIRDSLTAQANSAIASLETKNAASRVVFRTLTRDVDRIIEMPVYRDRCFDDAGLRLANLALSGLAVAAPDTGVTDGGMPAPLIAH